MAFCLIEIPTLVLIIVLPNYVYYGLKSFIVDRACAWLRLGSVLLLLWRVLWLAVSWWYHWLLTYIALRWILKLTIIALRCHLRLTITSVIWLLAIIGLLKIWILGIALAILLWHNGLTILINARHSTHTRLLHHLLLHWLLIHPLIWIASLWWIALILLLAWVLVEIIGLNELN